MLIQLRLRGPRETHLGNGPSGGPGTPGARAPVKFHAKTPADSCSKQSAHRWTYVDHGGKTVEAGLAIPRALRAFRGAARLVVVLGPGLIPDSICNGRDELPRERTCRGHDRWKNGNSPAVLRIGAAAMRAARCVRAFRISCDVQTELLARPTVSSTVHTDNRGFL